MNRLKDVAFVPDEMWADFRANVIDHFEYGSPTSVAVYVDGRRVEFDSSVTDGMIAEEHRASIERMRADPRCHILAEFRTTATVRKHTGVIIGWTA